MTGIDLGAQHAACGRRWGAGGGCPPRPCRRWHSRPNRAHTVAVGDAVLAGAGLGDDPPLAQPPGEQRLADRVVDLVRAGVVQVLALQPDARARRRSLEPLGQVERRRPADVVAAELRRARPGTPGRREPPRSPRPARRARPSPSRARTGRRSRRTGPRLSGMSGAVMPPPSRLRTKARMRSWSLTPGADSTPRARVDAPRPRRRGRPRRRCSGSRRRRAARAGATPAARAQWRAQLVAASGREPNGRSSSTGTPSGTLVRRRRRG